MNEKLKNEFDAMFGRRFLQLTGNNKYIELRDRIINWKIESIPMQAEVKPEIAKVICKHCGWNGKEEDLQNDFYNTHNSCNDELLCPKCKNVID